jgi:hypothetical protein
MTDLDGIRIAMENLADEIHALRKGLFRWKILVGLLSAILAIMLGVGVWVSILLWAPVTPFVYKDIHVPIVQSVQGNLTYQISFCKYSDVPSTITRAIVGVGKTDFSYPGQATASVTKPGCHTATIVIPLPPGTKPGTYRLTTAATFTIHSAPLRLVTVRDTSNVFMLK